MNKRAKKGKKGIYQHLGAPPRVLNTGRLRRKIYLTQPFMSRKVQLHVEELDVLQRWTVTTLKGEGLL